MQGKGDQAPWNFTTPLPRAAQRALKRWALDNDVELRDIGIEALELWAKKHNVALPPLREDPETERRAIAV
jgi:hypothetical protein